MADKRFPSTREFIDGMNEAMEKLSEENPEKYTLTCTECGEQYRAKDMADLYVCPICGKTQCDMDEIEE